MPPPSLSMTTIRPEVRDLARRPRGRRGRGRAPRSPVTIQVAAAARGGGADAGWRPGRRSRSRRGWRGSGRPSGRRPQEGLLVADRHARGGVDELAVAVGRAPSARCRRRARWARRAPRARRVDRLARRSLGLQPADAHGEPATALAPGRRRDSRPPAPRSRGRVGAQRSSPPTGRLVPAADRVDDDLRRAPRSRRATGAAACWSACRRSAGPGRARARSRALAGDRVVGGDDQRAVVRPAAELRGRLGEDRKAGGAPPGAAIGSRELGVGLPAGDDQAARRAPSIRSASSSSSGSSARGSRGGDRGQRPASPRPSSASGSVAVTCALDRDRGRAARARGR